MRFRLLQLGFIHVRLLLGTVILLLLIAVAVPNFVKAPATRSTNSQLEYAMWIEAAKQVWANENHKSGSAVPGFEELTPFLQRIRSHPESRLGPKPLPMASIGTLTNVRIADWEFSIGSVTQRVSCATAWDEPYFQERYAKMIATWPRATRP